MRKVIESVKRRDRQILVGLCESYTIRPATSEESRRLTDDDLRLGEPESMQAV